MPEQLTDLELAQVEPKASAGRSGERKTAASMGDAKIKDMVPVRLPKMKRLHYKGAQKGHDVTICHIHSRAWIWGRQDRTGY